MIAIYKVVISPNMHIQSDLESCFKPMRDIAACLIDSALKTIQALNAENKQESVFIHRDDEAQCFAGCDIDEVSKADLLTAELVKTEKMLSLVVDLEDNTNVIVTLRKE